ncbi:hypothetical protein AQUCO_01200239v1 [Aquilegia coerulea]|uniref:Uncharacterized protein n=1 Tax=Aquilegia coerulea TaxID=218851 RepID=A0A2G5E538_AQUCA|nr:hypothetical protein AQUCO_01200239v1 [Aquilegia coerulea]
MKRRASKDRVTKSFIEPEAFGPLKLKHEASSTDIIQSHINVMLKVAKILHSKGFHITFVNTEFNHQKVLLSRGPDSPQGLPDFCFETIPDGLPPSDLNATQDSLALTESITTNGLGYLRSLISRLNEESSKSSAYPQVSCIVTDFIMSSTLEAAEELGIQQVLLWPMSATVLDIFHHRQLFEKFLLQLKDMGLKDFPTFFWDGVNDRFLTIVTQSMEQSTTASAIIVNTFDALERDVLDAMKSIPPSIYSIGPLQLLEEQIPNKLLKTIGNNLLEEHTECLE